ncbi:MAG: glycosyltransferase family 4 protein [Planctomycetota bacterium]|jgi:glycosyltransferase involved in cell wall biosynthesis
MKICHVITRMILGGAQENTLLTCEGLATRGHEVTLITGPAVGPEGELLSRAQQGGYRVIVVDAMRREIRLGRDVRTYRQLKKLLGEIRPDVVHTHSSKAGILARRAANAIGGMTIVHTIHGLPFHPYETWWRNKLYRALERRAATYTDAIISVADAMTDQALAAGVGRPEQFTTIYSGIEVKPLLNQPPEADDVLVSIGISPIPVLVTQISRLAELKGHEYLLEAASRLGRHIQYCFVGDGRLRKKIEADIERMGLADRVHLMGLVSPQSIPAAIHAAHIIVHCSLREGLARALPQAMLAGKAVISFDVDGAREVVNNETGILIPARDVDALTDALKRLTDSRPLRKQLGQAGREHCMERFDHNRMVDRIEAVYEGIEEKAES